MDITASLACKKIRYTRQKREAKRMYLRMVEECDTELAKIDAALAKIEETKGDCLCPVCDGLGEHLFVVAPDVFDTVRCHACGGTGVLL